MLTRKFIAVDAYINKNKHSQINNQILYLKELEKKKKELEKQGQAKGKASRSK